ncbi:MAG TPA: hypothetical protein VG839_00185 [Asticcacaulis sp.]|nr:hypothetical protein [Asticcacaulis sp.]
MPLDLNRRALLGTATAALSLSAATVSHAAVDRADPLAVPDDAWNLWLDHDAKWHDDRIYLPADVPAMNKLPVNPPTGGWDALYKGQGLNVTLPATVEQFYWGQFQHRPYGVDEYKYASDDPVPQNGAYVGVSWWWRSIDIPASAKGQQVWLHLRGARLRAEVFLNEQLVGYSIMSELPIHCDLTKAMQPGQPNRLAIRITNPGGGYDWKDAATIEWGGVKFYPGHGFGGLDRGLTLSVHPFAGRIREAYVLNRPEDRMVDGYMELSLAKPPADAQSLKSKLSAQVVDSDGNPVKAEVSVGDITAKDGAIVARLRVHAPDARIWDLDTPNLYFLRLTWSDGKASDTATVRFGFRWFTIDGLPNQNGGSNALLRLNGRRIKLYSAISWGFWGYNALWPTPELAKREVTAAKALGLNSLSFHRNLGKPEVLDRQDEMGLTRTMEPGSGKQAIGKLLKPGQTLSPAEQFARDYMIARCKLMVETFRSHPSLLQYTLQNEIGADLANPDVENILRVMHAADPSRTVILNDGFVARGAAQAMLMPYSDHYCRSDVEKWGGWWVQHQSAGDQWYDKFYVDKDHMVHHETLSEAIIEFGEMEGCAVCDNHVKMIADILQHGGKSYDLQDHMDIVAGYNTFLDKWGFRQAFPKTEDLFLSIGEKQYASWQEYLENVRIGDQVDMGAISGWESTAIENHSGIVDNLRYFHGDPERLRSSLLPVRPVAKQRKLVYALGEKASLDIWLLNDTGQAVSGQLTLSVIGPDGQATAVGTYNPPANVADQYSYLLAETVATPAFTKPGLHKLRLELSGKPKVTFTRDLWVVDTAVKPWKKTPKIALSGIAKSLRDALGALSGVTFEDFKPGQKYDGLIASGLKAEEIAKRQVGDVTGNEAPSKTAKPVLVAGELPAEVLEAVKQGLPLLAITPDDGLADGVAKQLAQLGLFSYAGQVGDLRAPWMGNWNILRKHPVFDGIPVDTAAGILHQIPGQPSNGLLVDGEGVEIIAAYSRDHDRKLGASSMIAKKNGMRTLVHRMPDMVESLQKRFLLNAIGWLAQG